MWAGARQRRSQRLQGDSESTSDTSGVRVLIFRDLCYVYRSEAGIEVNALAGVSGEVGAGSLAVIGPSGSGKSTLLSCLGGILELASGLVTLDGLPMQPVDSRVSVVFQDNRLVDFLTVSENIRLAAEMRSKESSVERVTTLLDAVGLVDHQDRYPEMLSGGERQRVAIARTLAAQSRVVLADEPTGALDRQNSERVAELLATLARQRGVIVIVATHDPIVARAMDRTIQLYDGVLAPAI